MKLSDEFTRLVVAAAPSDTLKAVAYGMQKHNVGTMVVVDAGRPVGIVTDRDLAMALGVRGADLETPVRKVMTPHVLSIPEDATIDAAARFMREQKVRRLPIVDKNYRVVGIVSLDDLLRLLGREFGNLVNVIEAEAQVPST